MRTIDIHAHLMPQCLWKTIEAGHTWYGLRHESGSGLGTLVRPGKRVAVQPHKIRFTPEERLRDMDEQGVDVQVVSIHTPLFGYDLDPSQGRELARDVNNEIADMTRQWPQRFAGLATLPVQDVAAFAHGIARLVLHEVQRSESKLASLHGMEPAQPERTEPPESEAMLRHLRHCLDTLPRDGRDLLLAYYAAGDGAGKIEGRQRLAHRWRLSANALRSRVQRLRDRVEACVRGRCDTFSAGPTP